MVVGTVFGVALRIHPLLLPVAALAVLLGMGGYVGLTALVVLVHELSHAIAAKALGIAVAEVELFPLGGVNRLPASLEFCGWREVAVALAGPMSNILLSMAVISVYEYLPLPAEFLDTFVQINLGLALFNLLPALPMDGGRVLRALLAHYMSLHTATHVSVIVSECISVGMCVLGVYGIVQGQSNVLPFISGISLFWMAHKEERSGWAVWGARTAKKDTLHRRGTLATEETAVFADARLGDVLKGLSPSKYNTITVVDKDLQTLGKIDEGTLYQQAIDGHLQSSVRDLLRGKEQK